MALAVVFTTGCDQNNYVPPDPSEALRGTGVYTYDGYAPLASRPVRVFYHVPDDANADTPVVLVFHGNSRNASEYRDAWILHAEQNDLAVFAPEFSRAQYPDSSIFQLGGVFSNGESPTQAGLRPRTEWTFSLIEPLFDDIVDRMQSDQDVFHAWGHSAGAQFLHRLVLLVPDGPYGTIIAANSGWYTVPDPAVDYPYGLDVTPSASAAPDWFAVDLVVHAGTNDTDPGSAGLRHTSEADAQGNNRYERALYFADRSEQLAEQAGVPYEWERVDVPGVAHDFEAMADFAAPRLAERIRGE